MTKIVERIHQAAIYSRRVPALSARLAAQIPLASKILDVGCGDGLITSEIVGRVDGLEAAGIDVYVRPKTLIPVLKYDGVTIPYPDDSFDVVMFVDVLHHADDPLQLLLEAKRVARKSVLIKDHLLEGLFALERLKFMDWVGNAPYGVVLPYNYLKRSQWKDAFQSVGLVEKFWEENLNIYPFYASWMFDANLHFIAQLTVR